MNIKVTSLLYPALILPVLGLCVSAEASDLFKITILDRSNDWPVPMVELKTTNEVRFHSDNAGIIAFDLPELMGRECWFSVEGHGYGIKPDGFGFSGVRIKPVPGGEAIVTVDRKLPAKRLGRLTGAGIFGESQRLGEAPNRQESQILGCDSVQLAEHNNRLFWAWGDTKLARYPLGLFHMTGGTTDLRPLKRFEPPLRMTYNLFHDEDGRVRSIAKMPGSGPTWLSGLVSLPDKNGQNHLVGTYVKIRDFLTVYESGLCIWDENEKQFKRHRILWTKSDTNSEQPLCPDGHPVLWKDESGVRHVLFGDPFPRLKMKATFEAWNNPEEWEALDPQDTVPAESGNKSIRPHRGSIAWNEFRKKWVSVFTETNGTPSLLGEIWYAESDAPTGPWDAAVKVVTHRNYTFYNPRLHPELTDPESPILLFEGTFTRQFADNPVPFPRHDYNQIIYRLDLDDPALVGSNR